MKNPALQSMTDQALAAEVRRVAAAERQTTAELLALLIEVERRELHLALGYSSLFVYCTRALHFSEQAAYSRITAARAARRFPRILDLLANGALTLSSVGVLAPHLTEDTVEPLLESAAFKTTRDVERLIACLHAQPDIPATVRVLPDRPAATPLLVAADAAHSRTDTPPATITGRTPRSILAPLAPRRYLLRVTVSEEMNDKLQRARALLRHSVPDGDLSTILDRALTLLLRETERAKTATVRTPRAVAATSGTGRHVPAAVKREVWNRDSGQCAFVGPDGRCSETGFLEFHHIVPYAADGATTGRNLQLRCRAHNGHEARLFFGDHARARRAPS
jgi:5-methylcytosine-specific restriction endonuclease McrA